jgi:hypothetical protein
VAAIVIGYFTVAAITVAATGVSWQVLGPEGALREGSTVASTGWSLLSCFSGLLAAVCAGFVASRIGRHPKDLPVWGLALFLLLFGLSYAVVMSGQAEKLLPAGRDLAELTFQEAGQVASNPVWYLFLIPIVGALGVLLGGRLSRRTL